MTEKEGAPVRRLILGEGGECRGRMLVEEEHDLELYRRARRLCADDHDSDWLRVGGGESAW